MPRTSPAPGSRVGPLACLLRTTAFATNRADQEVYPTAPATLKKSSYGQGKSTQPSHAASCHRGACGGARMVGAGRRTRSAQTERAGCAVAVKRRGNVFVRSDDAGHDVHAQDRRPAHYAH